jgi:2-aminomuconate deaminase
MTGRTSGSEPAARANILAPCRRAGPFVFIAGMGPADGVDVTVLAGTDIRAQTIATIEAMKVVLEGIGGGLENLVDISTYLTNMGDFAGYNDIYSQYFSSDGPARTTVAVQHLRHADQLVEMRGTAYIAGNVGTDTPKATEARS